MTTISEGLDQVTLDWLASAGRCSMARPPSARRLGAEARRMDLS